VLLPLSVPPELLPVIIMSPGMAWTCRVAVSQHLLWFAPMALEDAAEVEDVCAAAMLALANSTAPVNKPSVIIETSFRVTPLLTTEQREQPAVTKGNGPSLVVSACIPARDHTASHEYGSAGRDIRRADGLMGQVRGVQTWCVPGPQSLAPSLRYLQSGKPAASGGFVELPGVVEPVAVELVLLPLIPPVLLPEGSISP
jgi:hypothetical protein